MADDKFSCIKEVTKTVHVALSSLYISNEIAGVSAILESWKRQYIPQLQGVVVSYKNVSLTSNCGVIIIDKSCVHYDVTATFELFCPSIGSIVKGKINRVNYDYVGCLVNDTINVAITLQNNPPDELSNYLVLDNMILFKITCFDFHRKVIRVKGEITDECIQMMEKIPKFSTPSNVFKNSKSTYYSSDLSDDDMTCDNITRAADEKDYAKFEVSSSQSQSLLAPKFESSNHNPDIFNCDHLGSISSGVSSASDDSDSSVSKRKSMNNHDTLFENNVGESTSEAVDTESIPDSNKSVSKKKKKHKDKKSKSKSSKKSDSANHLSKSSKKQKKGKAKSVSNIGLSIGGTANEIASPKKKKSSKKSKNQLLNFSDKNLDLTFPQDSDMFFDTTIKEEEDDIDSVLNVLHGIQPSLEDQLLFNQDTKTESVKENKKSKKRERELSAKADKPIKKRKTDGDDSPKKRKSKSNKKSKDKVKTGKSSKKDKKKKSRDKTSKSKKDKLNSESKKDKKSKTKNPKKSSKDKNQS